MGGTPRDSSSEPSGTGGEWRTPEGPDCWPALQPVAAPAPAPAWTGQRPAVQERLSRLVDTLEHDIIPRLVRAHAPAPQGAEAHLPQRTEVLSFTGLVLAGDDAGIQQQLAAMRARGVGIESLYIHLLAPAARHLGELWEDDRCHFADVTVGLGRLQQIMRGLSTVFGVEGSTAAGGRRVLLMPAPGEQHTFGLSMVAEFFARAGWEVAGVTDPQAAGFEEKVKSEWFDLVGISAGSNARLDTMLSCIAKVRRLSHNRSVAVMVGGPLFTLHPEMVERLGADGVATDGQHAPALAERLLGRRIRGF